MTSSVALHKVIVITGANRGLGLEFCRQLLLSPEPKLDILRENTASFTIVALSRSTSQSSLQHLTHLEQELQTKIAEEAIPAYSSTITTTTIPPRRLVILPCDVTDTSSIQAVVNTIEQREDLGRVDVFISNAGISPEPLDAQISQWKSMEQLQDAQRALDTNTFAPIIATNIFFPLLSKASDNQTHKVICAYISSDLASITQADFAFAPGYRLSKCALNMAVRQLASCYTDLTFHILSPGWVDTDMGSRGGRNPPVCPYDSIAGMITQLNNNSQDSSTPIGMLSFDNTVINY